MRQTHTPDTSIRRVPLEEPFETVWYQSDNGQTCRVLVVGFEICPEFWDFVRAEAVLLEDRYPLTGSHIHWKMDATVYMYPQDWPEHEHQDKIKPEWRKQ